MFEIKTGSAPRGTGKTPLGVAVIFGILALVFGGVGAVLTWPCLRASRWPTAPGKILESTVVSSRSAKSGGSRACKVVYEFQAGGKRFTGDKLDPVTVYSSGNGPYEDQRRFAPGTACEVHFDPEDPTRSCLRPEMGVLQWAFSGVGLLMLAVAAGLGFTGWWQRGIPGSA